MGHYAWQKYVQLPAGPLRIFTILVIPLSQALSNFLLLGNVLHRLPSCGLGQKHGNSGGGLLGFHKPELIGGHIRRKPLLLWKEHQSKISENINQKKCETVRWCVYFLCAVDFICRVRLWTRNLQIVGRSALTEQTLFKQSLTTLARHHLILAKHGEIIYILLPWPKSLRADIFCFFVPK